MHNLSESLAPFTPAELTPAAAPAELAPVVPMPVGRYAIPAEDTAKGGAWDVLKQKERDRVNVLLDCFRQLEAAPNLSHEIEALAFRLRHVKGFSAGTLKAAYYKWLKHGWKSLRRTGYTVNRSPLPPEFILFWRALCECHGRSIVTALDELLKLWFAGKPVPGYGELQADGKTRAEGTWLDWWHREHPLEDAPALCPGVPEGWSKSTLYEVGPTRIERRWATRGLAAVKPLLPALIRDTSKLLPLQLLTMDDFETDQWAFARNPRTRELQLVKVTGIAVMDVATRRVIALLMKPRFRDEDGKQEAITRAEVRLLFFQVLRDYGIPHCGQTWLVENAAAAITSELELTTRNLFGGRIQITRTGLIHDKVFANGFIERGGKPQQKGWIEARYNLVHNRADALPGQKGANYLVKPGDLEAKLQYAGHLIGQGRDDAQLTDEQISRLRLPFKSAEELIAFYMSELFPRLDARVEHKMGGFEVLRRWRRSVHDTWHEFEELAGVAPEEYPTLEWFPRELRESSRMRWDRLIKQVRCEKIAEQVLMMLLLTPKQVKTRKTGVTLTHNGKGYSFADKRALELRIPEGTDVLCYFDPARPHSVHICDLEGRHLVELKSLTVDITDAAAMDSATAEISALYNSILSTIRARPLHAAADQQRLEDRKHNDAIVAERAASSPSPASSLSPVRKHLAKRQGLTAALTRDCFAAPGTPVHTANAEEMAQTVIASSIDRAARESEAEKAQAIDPAHVLAQHAAKAKAAAPAADSSWM